MTERKEGLGYGIAGRPLSPKETEVLACIAEGLTDAEIAEKLGKSLATVKQQVGDILRKLGVSSRVVAAQCVTGKPAGVGTGQLLSEKQLEVLRCVAEGLTNAEVGERLFIAEKTVRNHMYNIFKQLGVHTRTGAVMWAKTRGLI